LVSKSTSGSGGIAQRNAIAEVSTGSFTLSSLPLARVAGGGCAQEYSMLV
jgi:hypothetical protein